MEDGDQVAAQLQAPPEPPVAPADAAWNRAAGGRTQRGEETPPAAAGGLESHVQGNGGGRLARGALQQVRAPAQWRRMSTGSYIAQREAANMSEGMGGGNGGKRGTLG